MNNNSLRQPLLSNDAELSASFDTVTSRKWWFTFGSNHKHPNGYVVIEGTFSEARAEMYNRYGQKWSMQYASAEEAGVEEFDLYEVK